MKKLRRLGPVRSSLEASTESLWLWSHRSGEDGWGCQAQQPAEGRLALKSVRVESSPQPQCRNAASIREAETAHQCLLPLPPWEPQLACVSEGMEPSTPWKGDVHSCASTTAARVSECIPGSGLQASVRSSCPALGKLCLVDGETQVYIPWDQINVK